MLSLRWATSYFILPMRRIEPPAVAEVTVKTEPSAVTEITDSFAMEVCSAGAFAAVAG